MAVDLVGGRGPEAVFEALDSERALFNGPASVMDRSLTHVEDGIHTADQIETPSRSVEERVGPIGLRLTAVVDQNKRRRLRSRGKGRDHLLALGCVVLVKLVGLFEGIDDHSSWLDPRQR